MGNELRRFKLEKRVYKRHDNLFKTFPDVTLFINRQLSRSNDLEKGKESKLYDSRFWMIFQILIVLPFNSYFFITLSIIYISNIYRKFQISFHSKYISASNIKITKVKFPRVARKGNF